ncbi:hypothetical protein Tco_0232584 [Tanacetum coccineum]
MDDNRTMAQLLEAPTEGYEDAIVVPEITANNFEIKHGDAASMGFQRNLHQLDTFYNAPILIHDQDSLNSACGDMVRALILDKKNQTPAPASVKAIEQSCVTCGGGHSYQNCPATNDYRDNIQEYVSQAAAVNYNQGNASYRPQMYTNQGQVYQPQINQPPTFQAPPYQAPAPAHPTPGVSKSDFDHYVKANDAVMQNMQNQMANITDLITKFVNSNTASTSGSGSLPVNTNANQKVM